MSADKYPRILSRHMKAVVYIFPSFQNCASGEKDLKDNKHNSPYLGRKYARIFVLFVRGHYLFRDAKNCELQGTNNVQGQISEHNFAPNGGYCVDYPSNIVRNTKLGISSDIPQISPNTGLIANIRARDAFRPIALA